MVLVHYLSVKLQALAQIIDLKLLLVEQVVASDLTLIELKVKAILHFFWNFSAYAFAVTVVKELRCEMNHRLPYPRKLSFARQCR
jgi:hypothetical protein